MTIVEHRYHDVRYDSGEPLVLIEECDDGDFVIVIHDDGETQRQLLQRFSIIKDILWVQSGIMTTEGRLHVPAPIGHGETMLDHFVGSLITHNVVRRVT